MIVSYMTCFVRIDFFLTITTYKNKSKSQLFYSDYNYALFVLFDSWC